MAFKMNTSIGKIHAKTQGTKPHAKAIATAQSPKPATGNVHSASNPLNQGSPFNVGEKAYVKPGGKATGKMSSYKKGSEERYAEYEARGWKQDDTTKGGESNTPREKVKDASTLTSPTPSPKIKGSKVGSEEIKKQSNQTKKIIEERNSNKPVKETRLDRRLAKTQKKGKNIADGKGVKTAKEQRKALRLKKRETRLKRRIEKKK